MSAEKKIVEVLSEYSNGNIWPFICPKDKSPEKYIVYNPVKGHPGFYADNMNQEWEEGIRINLYMRGEKASKCPINYHVDKDKVKELLENAGFIITEIVVLFEHDSGYTHICFTCNTDE